MLPPPPTRLLLTHGDYCLPNVMLHRNRFGGVLDVGRAGRGDPFRDYALVLRSAASNLGAAEASRLQATLPSRATSDVARLEFYRLLDELF
jgi:aminoglycoside phosphotransferase